MTVTITPTYSGCPAMDVIRADIRSALAVAGYPEVEVRTVLQPGLDHRHDQRRPGGASSPRPASRRRGPAGAMVGLRLTVRCPRCGSPDTEEISRFGSTACKALWRCRACGEPFDRVKPL